MCAQPSAVIRNRFMMLYFPQFINASQQEFCAYVANENKRIFSKYSDFDFSDVDAVDLPSLDDKNDMETPLNKFHTFIEERFPDAPRESVNAACLSIFGYKKMIFDKEDNSQAVSLYDVKTVRDYLNAVNESRDLPIDEDASNGYLMMNVADSIAFTNIETLYGRIQSMSTTYLDVMEKHYGIQFNMSFDEESKALVLKYDIPDDVNLSGPALIHIIDTKNKEMSDIVVDECHKAVESIKEHHLDFFIVIDDSEGDSIFNVTYLDMASADEHSLDELHRHVNNSFIHINKYQPNKAVIDEAIDVMNGNIATRTLDILSGAVKSHQDDKVEIFGNSNEEKPILYLD